MRRLELLPAAGLLLGLALALQACGDSGEPALLKPTPASVPEPAPEPTPETTGGAVAAVDIAAGKRSYTTFCVACHGVGGDGKTPFAETLDPPPTKHNNGNYMNALADDYLFEVIKQGGMAVGKSPNMAPWGGTLSDEQIRDVVGYIRTLADPPYTPPVP